MKSNSLCWNPMEAFIFTVANEDYKCYSFDMRNLSNPVMVYMDHVSAGEFFLIFRKFCRISF